MEEVALFDMLSPDLWVCLFAFLSWSDRIRLECVCRVFLANAWRQTEKHLSVSSWGGGVNNSVLHRAVKNRGHNVESLELSSCNTVTNMLLSQLQRACPCLVKLSAAAAGNPRSKRDSNLESLASFTNMQDLSLAFSPRSACVVPLLPPSLRKVQLVFRGQTITQALASSCSEALWMHSSVSDVQLSYPCCAAAKCLNPVGRALMHPAASQASAPAARQGAALATAPLQQLAVVEYGIGMSCSLYWCIFLGMGSSSLRELALTSLALSDALLAQVLPALQKLQHLSIHAPKAIPSSWGRGGPPHMYVGSAIRRFGGVPTHHTSTPSSLCGTHVTSGTLRLLQHHNTQLHTLSLLSIPGVTDLRPLGSLPSLQQLLVQDCPVLHPLPQAHLSAAD